MADGRKCTKCGEWKPWDAFYREPRGRNGRTSMCKACRSLYKRGLPVEVGWRGPVGRLPAGMAQEMGL